MIEFAMTLLKQGLQTCNHAQIPCIQCALYFQHNIPKNINKSFESAASAGTPPKPGSFNREQRDCFRQHDLNVIETQRRTMDWGSGDFFPKIRDRSDRRRISAAFGRKPHYGPEYDTGLKIANQKHPDHHLN